MEYKINYKIPEPDIKPDEFALIAAGDLRDSANTKCWKEQQELELMVRSAFEKAGKGDKLKRAHGEVDTEFGKHGFLSSAQMGDKAFTRIHPDAGIVIPASAWAYTHHIMEGLRNHRGKILLLSNDSGTWPGIVFLLQLRASLSKLGKDYEIGWGNDLTGILDEYFRTGRIKHDTSHVADFVNLDDYRKQYEKEIARGREAAEYVKRTNLLRMGIFDEYCMGMFAAVIEDNLLPAGVTKERLSQSALYAKMLTVPDSVIDRHRKWLFDKKMRFMAVDNGKAALICQGTDEILHLTEKQIRMQLAMYDAAAQIGHEFGCYAVGIQYQQGLKDLCPASDLAEGLLNASDRPPVYTPEGMEIKPGLPIINFNEVDECCGLDAMITNLVWRDLGMNPDTSLHDVRWSLPYQGNGIKDETDVAIWEISGSVPATWNIGGYEGSIGERQPDMYFRLGGSTLKGVTKPGEIVWSRIYTMSGRLHIDIGRGGIVQLPPEETQKRLDATSPRWPISNAVTYGITKDQFWAQHKSNHVNMAYADNPSMANSALFYKAGMAEAMGMEVHICGNINMTLDDVQDEKYRTGGFEALPYRDKLTDEI